MVNLTTGATTIWSTHTDGAPFNSSWSGDSAVVFEWQRGGAGQSGSLDQDCNVLSLGPGGRHPLVDCFGKLGALVTGQIVSLPGFPSPSSSGIAGQQAIAW